VKLRSIVTRTATIALAAAALAAPTAIARPADTPPAAANASAQDLNHLRAGAHPVNAPGATAVDSATRPSAPGTTYTSGATAGGQHTPGATAIHAATRWPLPGPPTWPVNPQPIAPARAVQAPDSSSGVSPTTIGLGIAGSLIALAGIVGIARRSRRVERARLTA
jgi:hypothetical protein